MARAALGFAAAAAVVSHHECDIITGTETHLTDPALESRPREGGAAEAAVVPPAAAAAPAVNHGQLVPLNERTGHANLLAIHSLHTLLGSAFTSANMQASISLAHTHKAYL